MGRERRQADSSWLGRTASLHCLGAHERRWGRKWGVSSYGGGMQTSKEGSMQDSIENLVTLFENGTLNRQQLLQGLRAAMAPIGMVTHAHADTSTTSTFRGRSLNHVTLRVTDVERSHAFYSR